MLWLKSYNACPPSEFYFRQAEAGSRVFGPSPLLGSVVSDLSSFRKGNNLPRSDQNACFIDIVQFTVARLDPKSEWVIETAQTPESLVPPQSGGCSGCGAVVT